MYEHVNDADLKAEYRDLIDRILVLHEEIDTKADALNALMLMDEESFHAESVARETDRLEAKITQLRAVHYTLSEMLVAARDELQSRGIGLMAAFLDD